MSRAETRPPRPSGRGRHDRTAACLRSVPVASLLDKFPAAAIPGVVDGKVVKESLGTATYETVIASVLGVSASRASAIAAEYPVGAYPAPEVALSALVSDANFACPALQVDRWVSRRVPPFAYQFDDGTAPPLFAGPGFWPFATHSSEIQYLLDQPNAPYPASLNATQEALAATMRTAWGNFAASGNPSATAVPWPSYNTSPNVLSLNSPQPQLETNSSATHHCSFWVG